MNDATLDALIERAAIVWADTCVCDPRPAAMRQCTCGERVLAEQQAADACGIRGWSTNPAVSLAAYEREAALWSRKR